MSNIFTNFFTTVCDIFKDTRGEFNSIDEKIEPDKRRTYLFDGVKVTANLFFQKKGKDVRQVVEDYLVKRSVSQLVKKD